MEVVMITCRKCNTINPTEATHCEHCGADLLPGETFKDRLVVFLIGIFGGLHSAGVLYFLMQNPELTETSECSLFTNPNAWFIGIFFQYQYWSMPFASPHPINVMKTGTIFISRKTLNKP